MMYMNLDVSFSVWVCITEDEGIGCLIDVEISILTSFWHILTPFISENQSFYFRHITSIYDNHSYNHNHIVFIASTRGLIHDKPSPKETLRWRHITLLQSHNTRYITRPSHRNLVERFGVIMHLTVTVWTCGVNILAFVLDYNHVVKERC